MKSLSIVVREDTVVPFDRWLATALSEALHRPVPRGLARKAIVAGLVTVGGRIVRDPASGLRRGPSVFVRSLDWLPVADAAASLRILFEDAWLIALDKPAGLPTHETADASRPSLTAMAERHVGHRVFVHHRLDAGTSGVVLFAKAPAANAALAASFAERRVEKTYVALIQRPPINWPTTMTLDSPLAVLKNGAVRVESSGATALTEIRVLDRGRDHFLVEARPVTGRKHQIRVHLAAAGAPVVGDQRYGPRETKRLRLMLHAERLELAHPVTGERLTVRSPRPFDFTVRAEARPTITRSEPRLRLASGPRRGKSDQASRTDAVRPPGRPPHRETEQRMPGRAGARGSRH